MIIVSYNKSNFMHHFLCVLTTKCMNNYLRFFFFLFFFFFFFTNEMYIS